MGMDTGARGSILICAVLAAIVVLIIRGLVRDRKKGKSTCGANCAHCAMAGSCHGGTHPAESTRSRTEKAHTGTNPQGQDGGTDD